MTRSEKERAKRERRAFSPEFKMEAVRLVRERKALGVPLAQIGRELDVRPDMLQRWVRQLDQRSGAAGPGPTGGGDSDREAEHPTTSSDSSSIARRAQRMPDRRHHRVASADRSRVVQAGRGRWRARTSDLPAPRVTQPNARGRGLHVSGVLALVGDGGLEPPTFRV